MADVAEGWTWCLCLIQLIKNFLIPLTSFTPVSQNEVCGVNHEMNYPLLMSFSKSGTQHSSIHKPSRERVHTKTKSW